MIDPAYASVEAAALTQGVAFLYAQAGELLKRRRDVRNGAKQEASQQTGKEVALDPEHLPPLAPPEGIFVQGGDRLVYPVPAVLDRLSEGLLRARRDVEDYVLGDAPLDSGSATTLQAVDRLRRLLEEVYDADLTFASERRDSARNATATGSSRQRGGITADSINVSGDFAGRDIHKHA